MTSIRSFGMSWLIAHQESVSIEACTLCSRPFLPNDVSWDCSSPHQWHSAECHLLISSITQHQHDYSYTHAKDIQYSPIAKSAPSLPIVGPLSIKKPRRSRSASGKHLRRTTHHTIPNQAFRAPRHSAPLDTHCCCSFCTLPAPLSNYYR